MHVEVEIMPMSKVQAATKFKNLVQTQTLTDAADTFPEREPRPDENGLKQTDAAAQQTLQENPELARILKVRGDR
jgi:hypothetical protein